MSSYHGMKSSLSKFTRSSLSTLNDIVKVAIALPIEWRWSFATADLFGVSYNHEYLIYIYETNSTMLAKYHGVLKQVNHGKIPWCFETGKPQYTMT